MNTGDRWFYLDVNPVPWAVGTITSGRKGGKNFARMSRNEAVHDYKEAIKLALGDIEPLPNGYYDLEFFFFRRIDTWTGESGRRSQSHVADATNMQKSTEDALQGLLIGNDSNVRRIASEIIEQSTEAKGCVVIHAKQWVVPVGKMPGKYWSLIRATDQVVEASNNVWPPR